MSSIHNNKTSKNSTVDFLEENEIFPDRRRGCEVHFVSSSQPPGRKSFVSFFVAPTRLAVGLKAKNLLLKFRCAPRLLSQNFWFPRVIFSKITSAICLLVYIKKGMCLARKFLQFRNSDFQRVRNDFKRRGQFSGQFAVGFDVDLLIIKRRNFDFFRQRVFYFRQIVMRSAIQRVGF